MLTKEYIREIKKKGDGEISKLLHEYKDSKSILFILKHLGHIPNDFDGSYLLELIYNKNKTVRIWAIKTIGKLKKIEYLTILREISITDSDTNVRRESISSIGRLRSKHGINILRDFLEDADPKLVCQAIRGLLVFKGDRDIDKVLIKLIDHENELVRKIISKEYLTKNLHAAEHKHTDTFDYLKNVVVNSDTIEIMKLVKDDSIHLTFTSPPYYNARDYSIYPSYISYLEFLKEVFKEVYRITKEGRFLIINTSPIIIPRISRTHSSKRYPIPFDIHPFLTEIGWEFIDDIIWLKPEASVKNRNGGFQQHRKPLAYKPNTVTEYLMVYRKTSDKLIDWNIKQYNHKVVSESKVKGDFETSNVWKIDPCFDKIHSAVFPEELCQRVIKYYSYKGDLIFDPFGGSGTVGRVANKLERYFFLTEKDENYFSYMKSKKIIQGFFDDKEVQYLSYSEFKSSIR